MTDQKRSKRTRRKFMGEFKGRLVLEAIKGQETIKHRNGIEGTRSELVRAHGIRRARYRGLAKAGLQNYFPGAACNLKRWIRRNVWELSPVQRAGRGPLRRLEKAARHKGR